jgi:hypothetical protein
MAKSTAIKAKATPKTPAYPVFSYRVPPTSGAHRLPTETKEKIYVRLVSHVDQTTHYLRGESHLQIQ